jgi:hypothetical protein
VANIVTSAGSFGAYILNPLLAGMTIRGLAADSVFVEAVQSNDNARRVLLTSGGTTLLTNTARNGILTFRVARVSAELVVGPSYGSQNIQAANPFNAQTLGNVGLAFMTSGDLVLYCSYLQQIGQATGSQITTYYDINGITEITTFLNCGLIKCDPFKLSGSSVQVYEISFAYSDFIRS